MRRRPRLAGRGAEPAPMACRQRRVGRANSREHSANALRAMCAGGPPRPSPPAQALTAAMGASRRDHGATTLGAISGSARLGHRRSSTGERGALGGGTRDFETLRFGPKPRKDNECVRSANRGYIYGPARMYHTA